MTMIIIITIIIASLLYFVLSYGFFFMMKMLQYRHRFIWHFPGIFNFCMKLYVWLPGNAKYLGERPAIIAPPESEWYHGRLDRYSAESRLRGSSKLGSYLGRSPLMTDSFKENEEFHLRNFFFLPSSFFLAQCVKVIANLAPMFSVIWAVQALIIFGNATHCLCKTLCNLK